jgi:hypothetical protein
MLTRMELNCIMNPAFYAVKGRVQNISYPIVTTMIFPFFFFFFFFFFFLLIRVILLIPLCLMVV